MSSQIQQSNSEINKPLVCICIPNYNNETTIGKTLDSLLNQTYENIVIKVFDNASTDRSCEIIAEYQEKHSNLKLYTSDENMEAEANFTRCIKHMEGKYSAIFHSDDIYDPLIIEKEVEALETLPISAVFCPAKLIDENGVFTGNSFVPKELINDETTQVAFTELLKLNLKYGNVLICPSAMSHTETFLNDIQSWDGDIYKSATDVDVWFRFAKTNPIGLLSERLINYRLSQNSFSFRRLKTRVVPLDIFLVLDDYVNAEGASAYLDEEDYKNYKFLKFRDNVVIERNCILNGVVQPRSLNIFDWKIFSVSLKSKSNFMVYCVGLIFKVINYKNFSAKLIKQLYRK
jgi:glycosyltransferase involved in cell wall biosynthesis